MNASRRPRAPISALLVVAGVPVAGAAAWAGIAALAASGPAGLAVLGGMVLAPCAVLAAQALRMAPEARRPLPVPLSDRDACPATGLACEGGAGASG